LRTLHHWRWKKGPKAWFLMCYSVWLHALPRVRSLDRERHTNRWGWGRRQIAINPLRYFRGTHRPPQLSSPHGDFIFCSRRSFCLDFEHGEFASFGILRVINLVCIWRRSNFYPLHNGHKVL